MGHSYNVWIVNHYATYFQQGGRHYQFGKRLLERGYSINIITANTLHGTDNTVPVENGKYTKRNTYGVPTIYIKVPEYKGNGLKRIVNMLMFNRNVKKYAEELQDELGKPDIIYCSSPQIFTCLSALQLGKKFKVPVISEVRDLWPATIVAMGKLSSRGILARILFAMEKYIYSKSSAVIFTMEGGAQYIIDSDWTKEVDLNKVFHINNGIDYKQFTTNAREHVVKDELLDNPKYKCFTYCGSIREANNLKVLIDAFKIIKDENIKLLIWGDGTQANYLRDYCQINSINNVIFKGRVGKEQVPSIVQKAFVNILHNHYIYVYKYGSSQNKLFEYLAAGKPILSTCDYGYNIITGNDCGVSTNYEIANIVEAIYELSNIDEEEYVKFCRNSLETAKEYDFSLLTDKLEKVFEFVLYK